MVACKTYSNENSAENFHRELANLELLKEGLRGSRRVMQHIAAIVHGNDFMILLPMAELYDLEVFLRGGKRPLADTRETVEIYRFEEAFPHLVTDDMLHKALLKELFEISSALVWLHEELHIYGSLDRYLAHLDLKPENILLTLDSHQDAHDPQYPAGKWMLTDFGVSLFDKETNQKATHFSSIRDAGPRLTSRVNRDQITRGHGPYEPPEVDLESVDARKCDVWSYGCILCDVLAFACGRARALHDFRIRRFDGRNDYFYRAKGNSSDRAKVINSGNTELKSEIREWFRAQALASPHSWVSGYVGAIEKALVPTPSDRPNLRDIMQDLEKLPHTKDDTSLPIISKSDDNGNWSQDIPEPISPTGASRPSVSSLPIVIRSSTSATPEPSSELADQQSTKSSSHHAGSGLGRLSSSSPAAENSDNQKSRISKYEDYPKLTITFPRKETVTAVALTPGGEIVAYLHSHHVSAYWTHDGSKFGAILDLHPHVEWTKVRIASHFLAIYGMAAREKHVSRPNINSEQF